jgi:hypothetical protein
MSKSKKMHKPKNPATEAERTIKEARAWLEVYAKEQGLTYQLRAELDTLAEVLGDYDNYCPLCGHERNR